MDAIRLLREDHRTVEALFKKYEDTGPRAKKSRAKLVEQITRELSVHAAIEEEVFYPAVREADEDLADEILEGLEEHLVAKWELAALEKMTPDDERFNAKVSVLIESVRHHVKEEEKELFPQVREAIDRKGLNALGERLEEAKRTAPTRPHPMAPDEPPANRIADKAAGAVDRARDAGRETVERVRERVG